MILKRDAGGSFTLIEGGDDGRTILSKPPAQLKEEFKSWGGVSASGGTLVHRLPRSLDKLDGSTSLVISCEHLPPGCPMELALTILLESICSKWTARVSQDSRRWTKVSRACRQRQ